LSIIKNDGTELANLDVNELTGMDERSLPVTGFYEPLITCAVHESREEVFVNVYHRFDHVAYMFTYDFVNNTTSIVHNVELERSSDLNFPMKSFYSSVRKEYLTFFRQGHCLMHSED
jgi:hypothetical protein